MNQLEFILRVLALIGIVFLISSMYWRLGKRLFGLLRLRERKLPLALISGILGVATILVLFSVWVYHGFGYQPDIYRVGNRASIRLPSPLTMGQVRSSPWPF